MLPMNVVNNLGALKIGIMQPYFLPYIGYFQLIASVDKFVIYDNIKYTKKGWINRNRILVNGGERYVSIPLKHASDSLDIRDRQLSSSFSRMDLLNQVRGAYSKAPYFKETFGKLEEIMSFEGENLFDFIHNSLEVMCDYLGIKVKILVSSIIETKANLMGLDRVLSLCKDCGADIYINPIGGRSLYDPFVFQSNGIELKFLQPRLWEYSQFNNQFISSLSIIDVLMFNSRESVIENLYF